MWASVLLDHSESLRAQARRCRLLATGLTNEQDVLLLDRLADEYEAEAAKWEQRALAASNFEDGPESGPAATAS